MELAEFKPTGIWRNGHIQSVLASLKIRRRLVERRAAALEAATNEEIVDCGNDVRLSCLHAPQPDKSAPVAVLIHGWEGSARSLYMLAAAARLFDAGFDVWRLQFRDHGNSHHLNRELFHSCRLDEVVGCVAAIQHLVDNRPLCLGGFSLGGNFSLRVAARADQAGIDL
ncbi:MAG: alpha/beta fold hydrolase, partial [Gammaproteobacteria bacterium]|nr:alpha/beta fold hydrolase [Gammaproteobacteria bacterium]